MASLSMQNFVTRDISRGRRPTALSFPTSHTSLAIAYFACDQMGYEFQKSIQGFDISEESKTFYSNGNVLLLPKIQRLLYAI